MGTKTYKDVIAWQKSFVLATSIYAITQNFPKHELYGITSQIRRSVVSIGSNIVEGYARKGLKESLAFYRIAYASLEESKFQLQLAYELNYLNYNDYKRIRSESDECGRVLNGWIAGHSKIH
ncbi:four helix bundle protein [Candidatus Falkowbacteria bacterium]|nr:four helix bundle protein [Candidatus Falkowbacteria bacterium]